MRVRLQYTDWSIWEGTPEDMGQSPDPRPPEGGIIKMEVRNGDEEQFNMRFRYEDVYYRYRTDKGWVFGSGTAKRDYQFIDGEGGCNGFEIPVKLPVDAVVRYGCTVSDEEAMKFGLLTPNDKYVLQPRKAPCVECGDG